MKKIFSKFEKNEKIDNTSGAHHHRESSSYVGKVFTVGRTVVTVEDILAEGRLKTGIAIVFVQLAYHRRWRDDSSSVDWVISTNCY